MEIPCLLEFTGSTEDVKHAERLCRTAMNLPPHTQEQVSIVTGSNREQSSAKRKTEKLDAKSVPDTACKRLKSSLSSDEMEEIVMGRKLPDIHITFAQDLLKCQFENVNGLECTLLQSKDSVLTEETARNKLQIFHDRGDHWIVASNVLNVESGQVAVYDSVYCCLDPITKEAIINKFKVNSGKPPEVKVIKFQKQKGSSDCGVFAIAAITVVAFGQEPSMSKFDQEKMRPHLLTCFQNKKMMPFPTVEKSI